MDHYHPHPNEVDLHILVVPESQWRPDLRLAYSTTCMTSVSAGFVRVDQNVSLVQLRGEISRQLDSRSLPQSYIFLRCVGRYLCTVSRHQELSLPSKLFVPPLAACPEIYLLNASLTEGLHSTPPPTSNLPPTSSPQHSTHTSQTALVSQHTHHHPTLPSSHTALTSQYTTSSQLTPSHHLSPSSQTAPTSQHTSSQSPGLHLSPSSHPSHGAPASHSHYSPHSTSEYMRSLESGGGGVNTSPNTLLQGLSPQDRADLHHHHHEQPPIPPGTGARAHQPKKNRSVHFGSPTTFGAHTPPSPTSPPDTTTPDTTTIDLDSLSLSHSGHHSDTQSLLTQIRKIQDESKHLGVLKEGLSSTIRQLQHKLQTRKENDNSEWKQKLDNERKRTKKLERSIRKLRAEIEAVDQVAPAKKKSKKMPRHGVESSVGGEQQQQRDAKSSVAKSESDHTNLKLECKKADVDMQQLRKTRDEEKQKLKLEQEKHQGIVDECKVLKKELNKLKTAQNRLKKK